ncbi:unnamed protein product [Trifolium pratense]|uniref:Uncharacterized protein n=1 Tax=Trifolium pratense TaxID=57577 RepID=A0ACB0IS98_TRIPR|nr:unnamed protein product [Trifolium pratense]
MKKRSSAKCGICGLTGHNRVSCKYRGESNAQSQTHSENNVNYVDDEFVEDNDDWNLSMVQMEMCFASFERCDAAGSVVQLLCC